MGDSGRSYRVSDPAVVALKQAEALKHVPEIRRGRDVSPAGGGADVGVTLHTLLPHLPLDHMAAMRWEQSGQLVYLEEQITAAVHYFRCRVAYVSRFEPRSMQMFDAGVSVNHGHMPTFGLPLSDWYTRVTTRLDRATHVLIRQMLTPIVVVPGIDTRELIAALDRWAWSSIDACDQALNRLNHALIDVRSEARRASEEGAEHRGEGGMR